MQCPKCSSTNVTVQAVTETNLVTKHHSIIWWICIGWWWIPVKWIFLTLPALIVKLFRPKRYKTTTTTKSRAVCQNCGYSWDVK